MQGTLGYPVGTSGKESSCQCRNTGEMQVRSLVQEDPLELGNGNSFQYSCLKFHGWRSLVGYRPQGIGHDLVTQFLLLNFSLIQSPLKDLYWEVILQPVEKRQDCKADFSLSLSFG